MNWKEVQEAVAEQKRTILLYGEIDGEMDVKVKKALTYFNLQSAEEVTMFIDSGGGKIANAFSIYDCIRSSKAPVKAVVMGNCFSAAVTVMLACNTRIATRHSFVMTHFVRNRCVEVFCSDTDEEAERRMFEASRKNAAAIVKIYCERTGCNPERARDLMKRGELVEIKYSADEAKELGFITEVVDTYPYL